MPIPTLLTSFATTVGFLEFGLKRQPIVAASADGSFGIFTQVEGDIFGITFAGSDVGDNGLGALGGANTRGITTPGTSEANPDACFLTNGSSVLTYDRDVGGDRNIYFDLRTKNPDGTYNAAQSNVLVNSSGTSGTQELPEIARLANGGFVIAWKDVSDLTVKAQAYTAAGVADGGIASFSSNGGINQRIDLIGLAAGGYAVSYLGIGTTGARVSAVNGAGSAIVTNLALSDGTGGQSQFGSLTQLANGNIAVVFNNSAFTTLTSRIFDSNFNPVTGNQITGITAVPTDHPRMATLLDGRFMVVFGGSANDTDANSINGLIYNFNGERQTEFDIGNGSRPDIETLADGRVAITYATPSLSPGIGLRWTSTVKIYDPREAGVTVNGTSGRDNYVGGSFGDTINGLAGNDVIDGKGGNDSLNGGDGNDTIASGEGNNIVNGGAGDDSILGYSGADTINGGDGNDWINGTDGIDVITGGAGNDTIQFGSYGADEIDGGIGTDQLDLSPLFLGAGSVNLTTGKYYAEFGFFGQSNIANIINIENILGSIGNDFLVGDLVANEIRGGGNIDIILGGGGNDSLYGEGDSDTIYGGDGNDYISGGTLLSVSSDNSGNILIGQNGDDTLFGDEGSDYLYAGADNDSLLGQGGNDVLLGEAGSDTIYGGAGNDYFYSGTGVNLMYGNAGDDVFISEGGSDLMEGGGDHNWYYRVAAGASQANGGAGIDEFIGGSAASNDAFYGGDGQDYAYGGNGDDVLVGQLGNDVLIGQNGNDTLEGGAGVNLLWANDVGNDQIRVVVSDGGTQVVEFFEAGGANDAVRLLGSTLTSFAGIQNLVTNIGVAQGANLMVNAGSGAQLYLNLGANQTAIWFQGVSAYSLTSADFLFV
jgi:Ca2+-binding RTX toxin-like protein